MTPPTGQVGCWLSRTRSSPSGFQSGAPAPLEETRALLIFALPGAITVLIVEARGIVWSYSYLMADGQEGGWTTHHPSGELLPIYEAAMRYQAESVPLVIFAGKEYGTGSSRDWAAKGTALLGVRAVIAESFERIHRRNLVGMGVLPRVLRLKLGGVGPGPRRQEDKGRSTWQRSRSLGIGCGARANGTTYGTTFGRVTTGRPIARACPPRMSQREQQDLTG